MKNDKSAKTPAKKSEKHYRFEAEITHTEDTIHQLFRTAHHTYHRLQILLMLGGGFALVATAIIYMENRILQTLMLLVGCWMIVSRDFFASLRAENAIQERNGSLPVMKYTFYTDGLNLSGEGKMRLKYSSIQRLVEDSHYFYLFQGRDSVCMVDRETLVPDDVEAFRSFIEERTGQKWGRDTSFLSMNLQDLLKMWKDHQAETKEKAEKIIKKH